MTQITDSLNPNSIKSLVDDYLNGVFDERIESAESVSSEYADLWLSIKNIYNAGGKRLRPFVSFLTYGAYGGKDKNRILPIASAIELLHNSMLAHDDIIDRDTVRHSTENITGEYLNKYSDFIKDTSDLRHFSESSALLAGDLLLAEAFYQVSPEPKISNIMHGMIFSVIAGELLDTEASFRPQGAIDYGIIIENKTASYSFVGPMIIGASLANAPQGELDKLKKVGQLIGAGFQLRDDLIGIFGDSEVTGKSNDGDIREGKQTALIQEFIKTASDDQLSALNDVLGNKDANHQDIDIVKTLLFESDARSKIEKQIDDYSKEANLAVDGLDVADGYKDIFKNLINKSLDRKY